MPHTTCNGKRLQTAKHKPNGTEKDVRNKHDEQMPHHSQSVHAVTLGAVCRRESRAWISSSTASGTGFRFGYSDLAGTQIGGLFFGGRKWVRSLSSAENTCNRVVSRNLNLWGFRGRQGQNNLCHSGAPATFSMYAPLLYVKPKSFLRYCMWQFGHSI